MRELRHLIFLLSVLFVSKELDLPVDYTIFSINTVIFLTVHMGLIYLNLIGHKLNDHL